MHLSHNTKITSLVGHIGCLALLMMAACAQPPPGGQEQLLPAQPPGKSTTGPDKDAPEAGQPETPSPGEPSPHTGPTKEEKPDSSPAPQQSHAYHAAVWSGVRGATAWTDVTLKHVRKYFPAFDRAQDVEHFCPGYRRASTRLREICWLRIIGGIVKFESGFNPRDTYQERNGVWSIGLFSLSAGECSEAPSSSGLKDPIKNLTCGIRIMARLIERDRYIDGPRNNRGAGSYWSVIRGPYAVGKRRHGKKPRIIAITKTYQQY